MSEASSLKTTPCSFVGVSEWDALGPVSQNANFGGPHPPGFDVTMLERQGNRCSTAGLVEQIPGLSCFDNDGFREVITSVVLPEEGCIVNPLVPTYFSSKNSHGMEDLGSKKRKTVDGDNFDSRSSFNRIQVEQHKNMLPETVKGLIGKDEKRQISGSNSRKSNLKQAKENPQNGNAPKEEYIHIRAKRGQATNSHSLAERVRRERISERMKYLQNIVPGCSKITGKAVMLDEIINYVQSLQRQVEFLSMKLATVNLDFNLDISQILPKDILHVRAANSTSLIFDSGMSNSSSHLHGYIAQPPMQSEMGIHNMSTSQDLLKSNPSNISHMPQVSSTSLDDEIQHVFQMGFVPNIHVNCTEQPGSMNFE